jgi:hypothetical protein
MKLTKICVAGICLIAVVGCVKKSAPATAPPVKWEYSAFEYHDPDYQSYPGNGNFCYIEFSDGNYSWTGSNNLHDLDSLLNKIGGYGWDLIWSDGKKFVVKRPADAFTNGVFLVHETMIKNAK